MPYEVQPLDMDAVTMLMDKLGIQLIMDEGNLVVRATYHDKSDNTVSGALYGWNRTSFKRASAIDILTAIKSIISEVEKYKP